MIIEKRSSSFSFIQTPCKSTAEKSAVLFVCIKVGVYMEYKQKTIYCPSCGRKVATYDGHSTINVIARCRKCNKRVVYYVDSGETIDKPIPQRNTSSGMTFV